MNINRDYAAFTQKETQIIRAKIKACKPAVFIDCHNVAYDSPTQSIGGNPYDRQSERIANKVIRSLEMLLKEKTIYYPKLLGTMGHVWAGQQKSKSARNTIGLLVESHRSQPPLDQVWFGVNALHLAVTYAVK